MTQERQGVITFKGNPLTLIGNELKVGDQAPDFKLLAKDLSEVSLDAFKGKTILLSVVPSLDTPVCDEQTKRFNEEATKLPDNIAVVTVSADLPFAQARWCGAANVEKVTVLSDHRNVSFAESYGVLIKELRLLTRSVFIIGADQKVQYAEVVGEVTSHPDYDKVLNALKSGAKA